MSLAFACAAFAVPAWAKPGLVRTVRSSASDQSVRVVIDLSRPLSYDVFLSADSTAVLVGIPGAVSESSLGKVTVGACGVTSVTTRTIDEPDGTRVEVRLQLDAPVTWKHFSLPASGGKPARIVIDVTRAPDVSVPAVAVADSGTPAGADTAALVAAPPAPVRPFTVAIDAGHGGHDTGTLGLYGLTEKKLTLDLAHRVADDLNRRAGIRAVLTRDDDTYLTLPERNEVAEKRGADIFVSIHLNSAPSSTARGAEIFFVAPAGAERAATRELASGDAAHEFGLDGHEDADIVHMLLDVNQQSVLARSEALAASILEEVRDRSLLPTRNVKQKSFSVLRTISMPSVLVEAGFLSNREDARLLRTGDGRSRIAHAIAQGIGDFLRANPPQRGAAAASAIVHRVQSGDTLWTISRRYHVPVQRICQLNGFRTSQPLHVGQEIVVRR